MLKFLHIWPVNLFYVPIILESLFCSSDIMLFLPKFWNLVYFQRTRVTFSGRQHQKSQKEHFACLLLPKCYCLYIIILVIYISFSFSNYGYYYVFEPKHKIHWSLITGQWAQMPFKPKWRQGLLWGISTLIVLKGKGKALCWSSRLPFWSNKGSTWLWMS